MLVSVPSWRHLAVTELRQQTSIHLTMNVSHTLHSVVSPNLSPRTPCAGCLSMRPWNSWYRAVPGAFCMVTCCPHTAAPHRRHCPCQPCCPRCRYPGPRLQTCCSPSPSPADGHGRHVLLDSLDHLSRLTASLCRDIATNQPQRQPSLHRCSEMFNAHSDETAAEWLCSRVESHVSAARASVPSHARCAV